MMKTESVSETSDLYPVSKRRLNAFEEFIAVFHILFPYKPEPIPLSLGESTMNVPGPLCFKY
jgi:hypothetical protein